MHAHIRLIINTHIHMHTCTHLILHTHSYTHTHRQFRYDLTRQTHAQHTFPYPSSTLPRHYFFMLFPFFFDPKNISLILKNIPKVVKLDSWNILWRKKRKEVVNPLHEERYVRSAHYICDFGVIRMFLFLNPYFSSLIKCELVYKLKFLMYCICSSYIWHTYTDTRTPTLHTQHKPYLPYLHRTFNTIFAMNAPYIHHIYTIPTRYFQWTYCTYNERTVLTLRRTSGTTEQRRRTTLGTG